jgi:hypothetical protein
MVHSPRFSLGCSMALAHAEPFLNRHMVRLARAGWEHDRAINCLLRFLVLRGLRRGGGGGGELEEVMSSGSGPQFSLSHWGSDPDGEWAEGLLPVAEE